MNITAFLIVSMSVGMFFSFIWSTKGLRNVLCKMVLSIYTIWAIMELMVRVLPEFLQGSNIKLF